MTDLYSEIERHCSYELSKIKNICKQLPSYTDDMKKAEIVRTVFISNGGGFGWGIRRNEQIEIDADGARLYKLINGTSGDTKTLQTLSFVDLLHLISEQIDTSADIPTETDVFRAVAAEFSERCTANDIVKKYKGCSPHGGSYINGWQICFWNNHVDISIPYHKNGTICFKVYKYTYEKIAKAAMMFQSEYAETKSGQLQFKI